ncbi:hypothetical protein DC31_00350 [Microbacterium sp. CH12i]|uniref:hypothetical protein n=1 Tax=Microbacterium sp. CH12i TaxID=1479651 RepID=UPI000460CE38|nr:hypothetical protein [Microbacterium sp. CH12i]KDA07199.1 hypothetical protein DC31_00350 [Microbacterium sp. CH12i]
MTDAPTTASINISLADFDGDEDEITRGALTVMLNHGGLARTLVDGVLELVRDHTLWRLTISGNMGHTVDTLTNRGADNPFTTARGAGHVGGITLTRDDGTFDIVISGNTLVATREGVGSPEALLEHTLRNAAHLARHEAGHAALALRGEDSASYRDVTGLTPTDDAHRPHLALHIEDHRIERYTAVHAPSPFKHAEHLTDAIAHLRRELNYSKQHWHDNIDAAAFRTMDAANGLVRVLAYLSAELGLETPRRPNRPDPLPEGWNDYVEESWDAWSLTFHRLRPVDEPMQTAELRAILADLSRLNTAWLTSIGINYGIDDQDREFIAWERDHY